MTAQHEHHESGATAVEYSIMVALVAALIIAVVMVLGNQTCEQFETTSTTFAANAAVAPASSC